MTYTRDELVQFTLQKLASLYPQSLEEETLIKEVFEQRASVSSYYALTSLIDIKSGWQEEIIQKYVDLLRENMPPENPVSLTPEDEARLDSNTITKDAELELQAKLDAGNAKRKGIMTQSEVISEEVAPEPVETPEVVPEVTPEATPEVTKPKKKAAKDK